MATGPLYWYTCSPTSQGTSEGTAVELTLDNTEGRRVTYVPYNYLCANRINAFYINHTAGSATSYAVHVYGTSTGSDDDAVYSVTGISVGSDKWDYSVSNIDVPAIPMSSDGKLYVKIVCDSGSDNDFIIRVALARSMAGN